MEGTTNISFDKVCRACMSEAGTMRTFLDNYNDEGKTLGEVFTFVTNMTLHEKSKLPNYICQVCEQIMGQSYSFKQKCLESEKKLNILIDSFNFAECCDVKVEILSNDKSDYSFKCSFCLCSCASINELQTHTESMHSTGDKNVDERGDQERAENENRTVNVKREVGDSSDGDSFSQGYAEEEMFEDTVLQSLIIPKEELKSENPDLLPLFKSSNKKFKCDQCCAQFKTCHSLQNHCVRKHQSAFTSDFIPKIKRNSQKEISKETKLQCSHCMRKFVKKSTLIEHLRRHDKPTSSHICLVCKREFKHRAHLDNHILSVHTTQNGLKCDSCPKSFRSQESLDLHRAFHENQKKHKCEYCSKSFNMLSTLRDHLRVHTGEKPFLCPTCGKGFTQNTNLIEHLRRHQGIKPFKCEMCDRRFVSKGELAAHSRKHSGAHPFVCDSCGNGFTTSSSLVKHKRTHTGERPYACDMCPMRFSASGTLKNHRRTHTGEKPYKCSHCEKAFVQKNDLVAHTRCHTGERPYVCSTCGQAFRQGSALKTHLKMHNIKENQPLIHTVRKELLMQSLVMPNISQCNSSNL